ncbi:MAG: hypothetical protein QF473_04385, partial [Planctomycetota bacterium]|nr:hypothetical protein [Planctomycetota bacterium]
MALQIPSILFGFLLSQLTVVKAEPDRVVNVRSFKNLVKGKDWSAAIQAAVDSVNRENGYEA